MLYLINDHMRPASIFDTWHPAICKPSPLFGDFLSIHPYWTDNVPDMSLFGSMANTMMSVHLDKSSNTYVVEAPTPGAKREHIKLEIVGRRRLELSIEQGAKGDEGAKDGNEKGKSLRKFFASVTLPEDADTAKGNVEYADGVVRVVFPKLAEGDKNHMQIQLDAENAALAMEVSSRLNKIKELREQLESEIGEAVKADAKLREAREEAQRKIASERRALTLI